METSWRFNYRGVKVEIDPNMVTKDGLYCIRVNGTITQRNITLKEVVSWMANAMMNTNYVHE